jgi:hypothetical protein
MDGHYCLDLGRQLDKFCLTKLLEVGMTIAYRRASARYCSTSWLSPLRGVYFDCIFIVTVVADAISAVGKMHLYSLSYACGIY